MHVRLIYILFVSLTVGFLGCDAAIEGDADEAADGREQRNRCSINCSQACLTDAETFDCGEICVVETERRVLDYNRCVAADSTSCTERNGCAQAQLGLDTVRGMCEDECTALSDDSAPDLAESDQLVCPESCYDNALYRVEDFLECLGRIDSESTTAQQSASQSCWDEHMNND